MRIAAGVILIIAAVINLIGAFGYTLGGAVIGGAGKLGAMVEEQQKKQGQEMTAEQKKSFEDLHKAEGQLGVSASALLGFGVFLFVTVGTSIAAAVCLFRSKAATFVMIAAGLALIAEVAGIVIIKFGVMNLPGLVGGILAILGARSIMARNAAPAGMPPAAAPM
jgi:hypothetical protein